MSILSTLSDSVWQGTTDLFTTIGLSPQVIAAYQNGTEPAGAYVTYNIIGCDQVGRVEEATLTDDGDPLDPNIKYLWFKAFYTANVQFNFIGVGSGDIALEFQHNVNNNRVVLEKWQKANLSPMRKSNIRNNPQKRETGWVDAYVIDVTFSYVAQSKQVIDWVEHIVVNGDFVDVVSNNGIHTTIPPIVP